MEVNNIIFVTHNKGKVASAQKHFDGKNIRLETYNYDLDEPRSDDIKEIARAKVMQAYELVKRPCFALDAGFYIEALNDFPKSFVNFSLETIGIEGILKLMEGVDNRKCYFKECLAYMENGNSDEIEYFYSTSPGTLANEILGKENERNWSKLWYIFIPEGYDKTFNQMSSEEMNERELERERNGELSAIAQFAKWI